MKLNIIIIIILLILFLDYNYTYRHIPLNKNILESHLNTIYDPTRFHGFNETGTTFGVDTIYCIVMPNRKEYMMNKITEMNVRCVFFDAITPDDLSEQDINKLSSINTFTLFNYFQMYKKKTKLALQLSFVMCYLNAIKTNKETIIVFEDDIKQNDLSTLPDSIEQFKTSDFKIFYLGHCYLNCKKQRVKENYLIGINDRIFCMHAIVYKVRYLSEIINNIFYMTEPIDNMLNNWLLKNKNFACTSETTYFDQNMELGSNLEYILRARNITDKDLFSCKKLNIR